MHSASESVVDRDTADSLVQLVRSFARDIVAPRVQQYDSEEQLPRDILAKMSELGLFGGTVPVELGGAGLDHVTFARAIEEMARIDHTLGVLMSMPSALVGGGLLHFGSDAQKQRWLVPLAAGRIFGGAGVTEPQSGSDVAGMTTTYRRTLEGRFVLRGSKIWISNLDISAFIVPADTPGVRIQPFKNKLGFRPLCTGELILDGVELEPSALLGEEGQGFAVAMTAVERGRLSVAARAVGLAQSCLDDSVAYARERVVFGQAIGNYQMVQQKLANMAVEIEAARLLVRACAEAMDRGERARREASMAKMFASDVAQRAATEAVQIHGAYGASEENRVARFYRDAKVFQIIEGTNEIHRMLIARELLGPAESQA